MNRTRIHRPFLRKVMLFMDKKITPLNYYDYNKKDRRVFEFIEKWGLSKKNGKVYHKGLQVIPYEDTEDILKKEAMSGGMPLSRDGAFAYLKRKYIGFKKNKIMAWLKRVESLQLTKRRTEVPRSKPARAREGATNWRMAAWMICSRRSVAGSRFLPAGGVPAGTSEERAFDAFGGSVGLGITHEYRQATGYAKVATKEVTLLPSPRAKLTGVDSSASWGLGLPRADKSTGTDLKTRSLVVVARIL